MLLQKCDCCGRESTHICAVVVPLGEGSSAVKDLCDSCKLSIKTQEINETQLLRG